MTRVFILVCIMSAALKAAFTEFVVAAERKFQSDRARRAVEGLRKGLTDRQEICNRWSQAFHKVSSFPLAVDRTRNKLDY